MDSRAGSISGRDDYYSCPVQWFPKATSVSCRRMGTTLCEFVVVGQWGEVRHSVMEDEDAHTSARRK